MVIHGPLDISTVHGSSYRFTEEQSRPESYRQGVKPDIAAPDLSWRPHRTFARLRVISSVCSMTYRNRMESVHCMCIARR